MISGSGEEVENVKTPLRNHNYTMNIGGATNTLEAQVGKVPNIHTINKFDITAFIRIVMVVTRVFEALGSSYD